MISPGTTLISQPVYPVTLIFAKVGTNVAWLICRLMAQSAEPAKPHRDWPIPQRYFAFLGLTPCCFYFVFALTFSRSEKASPSMLSSGPAPFLGPSPCNCQPSNLDLDLDPGRQSLSMAALVDRVPPPPLQTMISMGNHRCHYHPGQPACRPDLTRRVNIISLPSRLGSYASAPHWIARQQDSSHSAHRLASSRCPITVL